jgi:hypothetical protein
METEKNKTPVHEVRIGGIKAAIWENGSGKSVWHNVTLCRIYRDGDAWKTSASFGRDDLLVLAKVADQAHSWIVENQRKEPTE